MNDDNHISASFCVSASPSGSLRLPLFLSLSLSFSLSFSPRRSGAMTRQHDVVPHTGAARLRLHHLRLGPHVRHRRWVVRLLPEPALPVPRVERCVVVRLLHRTPQHVPLHHVPALPEPENSNTRMPQIRNDSAAAAKTKAKASSPTVTPRPTKKQKPTPKPHPDTEIRTKLRNESTATAKAPPVRRPRLWTRLKPTHSVERWARRQQLGRSTVCASVCGGATRAAAHAWSTVTPRREATRRKKQSAPQRAQEHGTDPEGVVVVDEGARRVEEDVVGQRRVVS